MEKVFPNVFEFFLRSIIYRVICPNCDYIITFIRVKDPGFLPADYYYGNESFSVQHLLDIKDVRYDEEKGLVPKENAKPPEHNNRKPCKLCRKWIMKYSYACIKKLRRSGALKV